MKSLTENYYTVFHASAIFQVIVGVIVGVKKQLTPTITWKIALAWNTV